MTATLATSGTRSGNLPAELSSFVGRVAELRQLAQAQVKARLLTLVGPAGVGEVDRTVGIRQFKDDPSLTDQEIATIVKWVDGGAPQGNLADMPPARQFPDGQAWQIGKPDLIVMDTGSRKEDMLG